MPILDEIRASASVRADACLPEIIALAFKKLENSGWSRRIRPLASDHWTALRRRQISPINGLEERYMYFVHMYTKAKINLKRYQNNSLPWSTSWAKLETEITKWRNLKDAIELGLDHIGVSQVIKGGEIAEVYFQNTSPPTTAGSLDVDLALIQYPRSIYDDYDDAISGGRRVSAQYEGIVLKEPTKCSNVEYVISARSQANEVSELSPKPVRWCIPSAVGFIPLSKKVSGNYVTIQVAKDGKLYEKFLPIGSVPNPVNLDELFG